MNYGRISQIKGTTRYIPQISGQRLSPYSSDRGIKPPHGGILPGHFESFSYGMLRSKHGLTMSGFLMSGTSENFSATLAER